MSLRSRRHSGPRAGGARYLQRVLGCSFASAEERSAAADLRAVDDSITFFVGLGSIAALVIFILIIIWTNQAHTATQSLWRGSRSWGSGWTVGAWFIPFANAVIPKLVLNEIERLAMAPRSAGAVADGWERRSTVAVGIWWLLFVGFAAVSGSSIARALYVHKIGRALSSSNLVATTR